MSEKKLSEKLLYAPKHGYDRLSEAERKEMNEYCEDYKLFLDRGKTERQCVEYCIELAEKQGFVPEARRCLLRAGQGQARSAPRLDEHAGEGVATGKGWLALG